MRTHNVLPLVVAMTFSIATLAGACGSDSEPSVDDGAVVVEAYFQNLERVQNEFAGQLEAVVVEQAGASEEPTQTRLVDALVPVHRIHLDALEGIEPPEELEANHEAFLVANSEVADLVSDLVLRLPAGASEAEALQALNDTALTATSDRLRQTCIALRQNALENGIEADLGCQE